MKAISYLILVPFIVIGFIVGSIFFAAAFGFESSLEYWADND